MVALPKNSTAFYKLVPKGPVSNLLFRQAVNRRAMVDPEFAGMMRAACRADFFFWVSCFVWTIDQKRSFSRKKLPFIPYKYQDKGFDVLLKSLDEGFDVQVEKSRQMGASWMFVILVV